MQLHPLRRSPHAVRRVWPHAVPAKRVDSNAAWQPRPMSSALTLWALLATLAAAQGLCAGQCRIAQDIVIVVDVDEAVLNSQLKTLIELLQLESAESRVALVKIGDLSGACAQPEDCAQVHAGFSSDTSTLTSQMTTLSSGDAMCPSCGLDIALTMLQRATGTDFSGRPGVPSVVMLFTTTANAYADNAGRVRVLERRGDTTVRPPR